MSPELYNFWKLLLTRSLRSPDTGPGLTTTIPSLTLPPDVEKKKASCGEAGEGSAARTAGSPCSARKERPLPPDSSSAFPCLYTGREINKGKFEASSAADLAIPTRRPRESQVRRGDSFSSGGSLRKKGALVASSEGAAICGAAP
jgi:hypothetical protein